MCRVYFFPDITFLLWNKSRAGSCAVSKFVSKSESEISTVFKSGDFRPLFGVQFPVYYIFFFNYAALLMRKKVLWDTCDKLAISAWVNSGTNIKYG